jgi:hypothetical protein
MVDALLLGSRPAIGILEHLLQELYQLVSFNVVTRLPSWIMDSVVLPSGTHLFLHRGSSAGQPISGHSDSSQAESFQLTDSAGISKSTGSSIQVV